MIIVGAGMAGLIAAHMLRRYEPVVWEQQPGLPDNHGALLRFRSDAVARVTGIPFRKVTVDKAVHAKGRLWREITPDLHNRYALKVTGQVRNRSILNLASGDRFIAPDDFIKRLARGVNIQHRISLEQGDVLKRDATDEPLLSTIPMPALMGLADWEFAGLGTFGHREVWSVTVMLPDLVDVYQTIYYPGRQRYYRASITGRRMILEYMTDPNVVLERDDESWSIPTEILQVMYDFGLDEDINPLSLSDPVVKHHKYGKLLPVDDDLRRAFILAMTDRHAIYSLGRFATWRQLLLDDIVKDVSIIEQFIDQRSRYARRLTHG